MLRKLILCFAFVMLLAAGANHCYAAFPIAPASHTAAAPAKYAHAHKTFSERKIPQFFSNLKTAAHAERATHAHKKTGWQGIASFACGLGAFGILFASLPVALLLTLLAIIFGALGIRKRKHYNTGFAIAGLILGCIGFVLVTSVIVIIAIFEKVVTGITVM